MVTCLVACRTEMDNFTNSVVSCLHVFGKLLTYVPNGNGQFYEVGGKLLSCMPNGNDNFTNSLVSCLIACRTEMSDRRYC